MKIKAPIFRIFFQENALVVVVGRVTLKLQLNIEVLRTFSIPDGSGEDEEDMTELEDSVLIGPAYKRGHTKLIKTLLYY